MLHLLLDALNVYGTGWWEPFSHHRVSGNLLFVADRGFYVGYRSVFDDPADLLLSYVPRPDSLLNLIHDREDVQHLVRFSNNYYVLRYQSDSLIM